MTLPRLADVIAATEQAGRLAIELGPTKATRKRDGSWVTGADKAVAAYLRLRLTELVPTASHLDEEDGGELGDDLAWVVDPIDGTTNFKRGDDRWCVSVALLRERRPVLGVIHQPTLQRTWAASPTEHSIEIDGPGDTGVLIGGRVPLSGRRWIRLLRQTQGARSLRIGGSVALDLVDVAAGRAEKAMALGAQVWDYAAGQVLVEQAGGTVTIWPGGRGVDLLAVGPTVR
jgi:myo-inositol-1(or 4)-monophosphatase